MRTAQDLLAERRANVIEQSRETDPVTRELLQFHIDQIDHELSVHDAELARIFNRCEATIESAGVLQPPIPVSPPPVRDAIGDAFTATRESVARLELDGLNFDWSPAQVCRRAA